MAQSEFATFSKKMTHKLKCQAESSFPYQLFSILEKEEYKGIIDWDPQGLTIAIKNREDLAEKVLPKYFQHNKFASFVRQLNFYGFKCHRSKSEPCLYSHPLFQKDNKDLLSQMIRNKPSKSKSEKSQVNQVNLPVERSCSLEEEISDLMQELRSAHMLFEELRNENKYLRSEARKIFGFNNRNLPSRKYEAPNQKFDGLYSFQPSQVNQAPVFENSEPLQPNERTIYAYSKKAQQDPLEYDSYLPRIGTPNLNNERSEQYAEKADEHSFLSAEHSFLFPRDRNYF